MEENNNFVASILLGAAVFEVLLIPFIGNRVQGQQKLIVMGSMLMGAVMTAGIGMAFYMGWL